MYKFVCPLNCFNCFIVLGQHSISFPNFYSINFILFSYFPLIFQRTWFCNEIGFDWRTRLNAFEFVEICCINFFRPLLFQIWGKICLHPLTRSLSLIPTHIYTHLYTLTYTHIHSLTLTLSLKETYTHSHTLFFTLSPTYRHTYSHSHTRTYTHSHKLSLTHTHTLTHLHTRTKARYKTHLRTQHTLNYTHFYST